jgi:tetratricopeptide (TPR) repeat protein
VRNAARRAIRLPNVLTNRALPRILSVRVVTTVLGGLFLLIALLRAAEQEPDWQVRIQRAHELRRAGSLISAESELRHALQSARRDGEDGVAAARVYGELGSFYVSIGKIGEAEHMLQRSLAIWKLRLGPEDPMLTRPIHALAALYLELSDLKKADQLEIPAWAERLEARAPHGVDYAHLLEDLGALYSLRGDFPRAEQSLLMAIEIFEPGSTERAIALNNLGVACLDVKRYEEASKWLSKSLEIWQSFGSASGLNSTLTEHSLAVAFHKAGHPLQAAPLFAQAAVEADRYFGPTSVRTASVIKSYAEFLRDVNRKGEAKKLEERVRAIMADQISTLPLWGTVDAGLSLRAR